MSLFKFVIIFGLLFCNILQIKGQPLNVTSKNASLNFETKEAPNPEDYPEGFADGLGKGAIEANSEKRLSKVESYPEIMGTPKSLEPDVYVESKDDKFLYLSNDYVADPANVKVELVQLPTIDLYYKGCTIQSIDPNSQPSSLAFDVRGILDDCQSECASETLYRCSAYTFGGPGTYCVLHGPIDYGHVYPKIGSEYSITDVECLKNGSEYSSLQMCQFQKVDGIRITPTNIAVPYRQTSVLNKDHCELLCNMNPFVSICTSFAFNPNIFTIGDQNCVLFSRNISVPIKFAKGDYDVYENPCFLSDYAN